MKKRKERRKKERRSVDRIDQPNKWKNVVSHILDRAMREVGPRSMIEKICDTAIKITNNIAKEAFTPENVEAAIRALKS